MHDIWSANIVSALHLNGIRQRDLAKMTGYTEQYISLILNRHRNTQNARKRIENAVKLLRQG